MFRGREVTHPERGTAILDRLAEELSELGVVEQRPMQEGRNMTMMMAPSKAVLSGRVDLPARAPASRPPQSPPTTTRTSATSPPPPSRPRPQATRPLPSPRRTRRQQPIQAPRRPSSHRPQSLHRSHLRPSRHPPATVEPRPRAPPCHNLRLEGGSRRPQVVKPGPSFPDPMPKMKTHSGAKKRFKVTGTGKVRGRHPSRATSSRRSRPKRSARSAAPRSSTRMTCRASSACWGWASDPGQALRQRAQEASRGRSSRPRASAARRTRTTGAPRRRC